MKKSSVLLEPETPPAKPAKKLKPLTAKQQKIVEAKLEGKTDFGAVRAVGHTGNSSAAARTEEVKQALAIARSEITSQTTLTRLDVIDGILDAIQLARLAAEPASMIQGYDKLAKIMGFYAPETIKVEVSVSQERLRQKMESMSDEDLLRMAEGHTVDGEFTVVTH